MRKIVSCCIVMMSILLTSCGNKGTTVQKMADAYKDATSQIDGASDDEECVKIHSDLIDKLCDIVAADPEFLEKIEKTEICNSDIELVEEAYNEYEDKLREKISSECYAFLPFADLSNIEQKLNEGSESNSVSNYDSDTEENIDTDNDSDSDEISSSDSEDWDDMLESYEEYVDQYISCLKKASSGDMNALSEYPALLEKAQEFSEKMENAQGGMSASQWAKYNEITQKMLKAAQEMNE